MRRSLQRRGLGATCNWAEIELLVEGSLPWIGVHPSTGSLSEQVFSLPSLDVFFSQAAALSEAKYSGRLEEYFRRHFDVRLILLQQEHGAHVHEIQSAGHLAQFAAMPTELRRGDGYLVYPELVHQVDSQASSAIYALGIRTADCMPVALHYRGFQALLHIGWQGLHAGILEKCVQRIQKLSEDFFRCKNQEEKRQDEACSIFIGPCIQRDSYEVGGELIETFFPDAVYREKLCEDQFGEKKVSVHGVKNIIHYDELERQLFHPFLSKPNRLCSFCERLVVVTPDLLRKSTPEGLFAKQFRVDKSFNPPERLQKKFLLDLPATLARRLQRLFPKIQFQFADSALDTFTETALHSHRRSPCNKRRNLSLLILGKQGG